MYVSMCACGSIYNACMQNVDMKTIYLCKHRNEEILVWCMLLEETKRRLYEDHR